jgi:hypothetical protein
MTFCARIPKVFAEFGCFRQYTAAEIKYFFLKFLIITKKRLQISG